VAWLVGEPGVGKTALARALLGSGPYRLSLSPKWTIADGVIAAGHYTGATFDGADTISYSGGAALLESWASTPGWLTILDGDRLSHAGAVEFFKTKSARRVCVYVHASAAVVGQRRAERGSDQNPTWLKGRKTKARRFFEGFDGEVKLLDARLASPEDLALSFLTFLAEPRE